MVFNGPPLVGVGDLEEDDGVNPDSDVDGGHGDKTMVQSFFIKTKSSFLCFGESHTTTTCGRREKPNKLRQSGVTEIKFKYGHFFGKKFFCA